MIDNKKLIVGMIAIGLIAVVVIAFVVVYQFAQQQDDRQKAINAIKETEQKAQEYQACLEKSKDDPLVKRLRTAEKLLELYGDEVVEPHDPCAYLLK